MIDGLLTELGKKVTERWLTLILLPGLCFVAALWCAVLLGHSHAVDVAMLIQRTRSRLAGTGGDAVTVVVTVAVVLLVAVAAAGLARLAVGAMERLWLLERRGRRVTWPGRRLALVDERVRAEYHGLRAALVWPRLWSLLEEHQRLPVQQARTGLDTAATTIGWGLLYALAGCAWWPGLLIAVGLLIGGATRARRCAHAYATLVESLVDIRQGELALALGMELPHGLITADEAGQINARLHKGGPDHPVRRRRLRRPGA
ncbi:hypothetical protein ACIBQX_41290 [Nonomuraea sp. NPDC049714]|uniref:hypothetical protein n=1 Tax=Nonomuraea sp. NPDC049714 TaxID=3364357 RepID=UPI0037887994